MEVLNLNDGRADTAIELLENGRSFSFDNVEFWLDSGRRILEVRANSSWETNVTNSTASVDLCRGMEVYRMLVENDPAFARIASQNHPRFSLIQDYGMGAAEICYLSDGVIRWN
jgi:hypothetical protein